MSKEKGIGVMREGKIYKQNVEGKITHEVERVIDLRDPKGFEDLFLCSHQNVKVDEMDSNKGVCFDCQEFVRRYK